MNEVILREMQERNLNFLARDNGFQFTDTFFPYTSGQIGPYYVQSAVIQDEPKHARVALNDLANLVAQKMKDTPYQAISGGETRDWIFSIPIATMILNKPHVMLYKDGKHVGLIDGRRFAHIADLNNEGSSPRDFWIPTIRKVGGTIDHIFFYVDRLEEGAEEMQKLGLKSYALVPLDAHAWDHLQQIGVVIQEVYRNLRERGSTKEERDIWAVKMIRSEKGLEALMNLIKNSKTIDKAAKILWKGYPDLELEIRERLEKKLDNKTYIEFWSRIVSQRQEAAK